MNPTKISFGFTKKIHVKNLQESANKKGFSNSSQKFEKNEAIQIKNVADINRKRNLNENKEYSIAPLENDRDRIFKNIKKRSTEKDNKNDEKTLPKPMTLDEMAVKELCEENSKSGNGIEEMTKIIGNVPVSELPKGEMGIIPSANDYEEMPVESFGDAILNGLGCKKGQGIGKNPKIIQIVEPTNRTFGLTPKKPKTNNEEEEEEIPLKQGSCVLINGGKNKGNYGTVDSLDIDHSLIKLARDQSIIRVIEQHIEVVSSDEFKDCSRVINKQMYDQYKEVEKQKKKFKSSDKNKDNNYYSKGEDKEENKKLPEPQTDLSELGDHIISNYKNSRNWLIAGLRVKIVGKSFRKGCHYKEKVVIKSLDGKDQCTCLTEDNKLLDEVYEEDLETVIPHGSTKSVLIVNGSSKGERGFIMKNDKEKQEVAIAIEGKSVKKRYDDVCEYTLK